MKHHSTIAGGALLCLIALTLGSTTLHAQPRAVGDWHGTLQTPAGNLTLIVTISEGADGALEAVLKSPDQAPGQKIPISTVSATDETLTFAIQAIAATYEGRWNAADGTWVGVFTQSGEMPLTLTRGRPAARPVIEGLDGKWEGTLTRNGVDLRLILEVHTDDEGTVVTLDSPDMMSYGIPVMPFEKEDGAIRFGVPAAAVTFRGTLHDEQNHITGTWTRAGQPGAEVTFVRASETEGRATRYRPQTPRAPFPYDVEDVTFDNPTAEGVRLAGTLTLPRGAGPYPAAVLISGSGPQDRDETIVGHKPFAVLADHLTRAGIAVLRYDDRGFGASTGDHGVMTSADFATDANAAAGYLATRAEIDPGAIGFIGHSEGGMIAPIAAVENDGIAYIVSLAGPGTNTLKLSLSQRRLMGLSQGASLEDLERTEPVVRRVMTVVQTAPTAEEARERVDALLTPDVLVTLGIPPRQREIALQQLTRPWLRYFLRYDPADYYLRINVPVLAINGSLDVQVSAGENLAAIERALDHNPDVTIRALEGLNHLFQTATTGGLGEYADIEESFAPAAMELVTTWILERFEPARSRSGN